MASALLLAHVFVDCPFDDAYKPIFDAIVFAIHDLGFVARCALEADDSGELRFSKIERIVEQCRFGIHDLSAVELDPFTHLPRFNMPLELGLFLGCKRFGSSTQRRKLSLILDTDRYRYRQFISDISGHDIHAHGRQPEQAVREVRNWLAFASHRQIVPGAADVVRRYRRFRHELPRLCAEVRLEPGELTFGDYSKIVVEWLQTSR